MIRTMTISNSGPKLAHFTAATHTDWDTRSMAVILDLCFQAPLCHFECMSTSYLSSADNDSLENVLLSLGSLSGTETL